MLKQRVITALLIGLPMLGVLFGLPRPYAVAVFAIVILLGAWEWSALAQLQTTSARWRFVVLVAVGMALSWYYLRADGVLVTTLNAALAWWLMALLWIVCKPSFMSQWLTVLAGLLVLVPSWLAIVLLHLRLGPLWVVFLLLMVVSADVGGFLFGKYVGRTKLAPRVSPGKTWEGVGGGLVLSMLVALLGSYVLPVPQTRFLWLCLLTVVMSVIGDLTESLFKRAAGLKDSGSLLPGHGGVLDRIDSITAAAPVFVGGLIYLGVFAP